uniref:NADH dehydrogenase subunit 2 n=1 Tax=Trochus sacellum TaxID=2985241 RepID=UPI002237AB1C|nr:NADH dehydrogenase subunit 2 [Trochus sacellum]UYC29877.1 NADH dehydrogenase subunit 2 [Trochus sacellum]
MFSFKPYSFLFIFILIFGSMLSLSSLHWLSIWMGLEINLMGFIPILIYRGVTQETESGMKYFIMQALGSGMIMAGSLLAFNLSLTWDTAPSMKLHLGVTVLLFGLMLKLGSFPFHFWLPSVMAGISWLSCLLLTTWQKLAPLFLLAAISSNWTYFNNHWTMFLLVSAGMSSLIGGIGGMNQTQIRALLAYSSIGHIGWMIMCSVLSSSALKTYFIIYFTVSISVFMALWNAEKSFFSQTSTMKTEFPKMNEISLILMLLSLGGMPPLLGFLGKWLAIWSSCMTSSYLVITPLLTGSLISLFYYLSLLFSITLFSSSKLTLNKYTSPLVAAAYSPNSKTFMHNFSPMMNMIFMLNLVGGTLIMFSLSIFDFI